MKKFIKLLNVDREFKQLEVKYKELSKTEAAKASSNLLSSLIAATPIDTGFARESWSLSKTLEGHKLRNSAEYIKFLNEGTSLQAPRYFIEATALRYGRPFGAITTVE